MAATFTFGAAMTLRAGGHIRVMLARVSAAARGDAHGNVWALGGVAFRLSRLRHGQLHLAQLHCGQISVSSATPLWIPQALVSFGMFLLTLQFVARFFQAALGLPLEDRSVAASVAE